MRIVDAQVHIWASGKPTNPNHRQVERFTKDDLLKENTHDHLKPIFDAFGPRGCSGAPTSRACRARGGSA
jgi:hypothetical protein